MLAPDNDALNTLGDERVRFLLSEEGVDELDALVSAHVFAGAFSAEDIARGKLPANLAGQKVEAHKGDDGLPRVQNTGKILDSMEGSNGFVHIIDTVIH